jgi:hypothetical protein
MGIIRTIHFKLIMIIVKGIRPTARKEIKCNVNKKVIIVATAIIFPALGQ